VKPIYKRSTKDTGELVKGWGLAEGEWSWIYPSASVHWRIGNHNHDYVADVKSCLLELTLLRPELNYEPGADLVEFDKRNC
jgi:hypothetical protein